MGDQFTLGGLAQRPQRQQPGVVAQFGSELRLADRLRGATAEAGDEDGL